MSDTDSLGESGLGASSTATVVSVDGEDSDSIGGPSTAVQSVLYYNLRV